MSLLAELQRRKVFKVGAAQSRLALPVGAATVMENAGNAADASPSLTLITMPG